MTNSITTRAAAGSVSRRAAATTIAAALAVAGVAGLAYAPTVAAVPGGPGRRPRLPGRFRLRRTGHRAHRHLAGRCDLADREAGELQRHPGVVRPRHAARPARTTPRWTHPTRSPESSCWTMAMRWPDPPMPPRVSRWRKRSTTRRTWSRSSATRSPNPDHHHCLGHLARRHGHRGTAGASPGARSTAGRHVWPAGRRCRPDGFLPRHPFRPENPYCTGCFARPSGGHAVRPDRRAAGRAGGGAGDGSGPGPNCSGRSHRRLPGMGARRQPPARPRRPGNPAGRRNSST